MLLTLGQMLVAPAARAWVPDLAEDGRLGLYTGALSSVSGLVVLAGSSASGSLLDSGLPGAVPWLVLAAVPLAAVGLLPRRHPATSSRAPSGTDADGKRTGPGKRTRPGGGSGRGGHRRRRCGGAGGRGAESAG